jgi:hypothetical protein
MEMDANRNVAAFSAVMLSLGTFAVAGPIIHAAHGSWPKAGYSFVLRFVLMSIGAAVGANTDCDYAYDHEGCWVLHAIYGLAVGGAVAGLLDAAVIGHERVVRPTGSAPVVGFMPLRGGGGLSLVGRF